MKRILITFICLILCNNAFAQNSIKEKRISPLSIGEEIEIESIILNENRLINVYLPYGYSKNSLKAYPVIYLLDGSIDEDFIHISGLVQFGSFSWVDMIPETIVVGIANIDRRRDFTFPTNNKKHYKDFPTSGKSEGFINFIENELQPFIEKKYNTNSIKTIIGQSLGGLLVTEILLKKSELFDNYIIVSPSLWWNDKSLLERTWDADLSKKSIFIATGKEGQGMEESAKELYDNLQALEKENTNIHFEFFEELNHGDILHLAVYNAFNEIFEKK